MHSEKRVGWPALAVAAVLSLAMAVFVPLAALAVEGSTRSETPRNWSPLVEPEPEPEPQQESVSYDTGYEEPYYEYEYYEPSVPDEPSAPEPEIEEEWVEPYEEDWVG